MAIFGFMLGSVILFIFTVGNILGLYYGVKLGGKNNRPEMLFLLVTLSILLGLWYLLFIYFPLYITIGAS